MKIKIWRGQNQIGGSIIEVASDTTRVILDIGSNLDEKDSVEVPQIDGLFQGKKSIDAVVVSHYHSDHVGLLPSLIPGIPVYMGEIAYQMFQTFQTYLNRKCDFAPKFIHNGKMFEIGNIKITPFHCDHAAFDSYMFLLEVEDKIILYTGDFRANGYMEYSKLLSVLPSKIDVLITEGTNLSRMENEKYIENLKEEELIKIAIPKVQKYTGPVFIIMSAMNIDRLITMKKIADETKRILLEDIYTALVASSSRCKDIIPQKENGIRVFPIDENEKRYAILNKKFADVKIGRKQIAKENYIMVIRASMLRYLKRLQELQSFENGICFYGMWQGYKEEKPVKEMLQFMEKNGVKIHTLHTSGHADTGTIDKLIQEVHPDYIVPVHTENAHWYDNYKLDSEGNQIKVICDNNEISL